MVFAQSSDTSTVTVTISGAAPDVTSVEYVDSSYATETAYDPNNSDVFGINFTVTDVNTLADLLNITVYLYDDSVHSGDFESASPNGYDLIVITWVESTDTWNLDDGSFTEWTETSSIDAGTGSGLSTYEFTARFDISRGAYADTDWEAAVRAYDDSELTDLDTAAGLVQMNNYFELVLSGDGSIAYGSVDSLSVNNTASTNRTMQIWSNTQWEIRFDITDFTGGATVDTETIDCIIWDEDGVASGTDNQYLRNTQQTATGTWDNQGRMSATETPFNRNVYVHFTDTGDFDTDTLYTATLTFYVYANA